MTIKQLSSNLVNCYTKQKVKVMSDNKQAHKSVLLFTFFPNVSSSIFTQTRNISMSQAQENFFFSQAVFQSKTFQHDKKHYDNKIQ